MTMKKLVSNMANMVSATRVKVLCLAALVVLTGVNVEVWGQTFDYRSTTYGAWNNPDIWTSDNGKTGYPNGSTYSVGIYNAVTIDESTTTSIKSMDISGEDGELTINGSLTIESGIFAIYKNVTLNGSGSLIINGIIDAKGNATSSHSLTTNIDVTTNNDANYNNYLELIVNGGTFTNNRKDGKEIKSITINTDGTFIAKTSIKPWYCTMNGGILTINEGKTFTVNKATDGYRTLYIEDDATITGNGTLDVQRIKIEPSKTLTINGNITLNQSVIIDGDITIGDDCKLTLKGSTTTIDGNIKIGSGSTLALNSSTTTIRNLTESTGSGSCTAAKAVIYEESCNYIIPGTYNGDLTTNNSELTLCGDVTANSNYYLNSNTTINGKTGEEIIYFNGAIRNNNSLTLNVNGTASKVNTWELSELNVGEDKTLTMSGTTTINNEDLVITGNILINKNCVLKLGGENIYFSNDDNTANITGEGKLQFTRLESQVTLHPSAEPIHCTIAYIQEIYTVAQTGNWTDGSTWIGGYAPSTNITDKITTTIEVPTGRTLTVNEDVTINKADDNFIVTLTGEGLIVIDSDRTFSICDTKNTSISNKNGNRVNLDCNIEAKPTATLELCVLNVFFNENRDYTFDGTVAFSRQATDDARRTYLNNIKKRIDGTFTFPETNSHIIYENNCTYMLPGTYCYLESSAPSLTLYGDVESTEWYYNNGIIFNGEEGSESITLNKIRNGGNYTFNVNATINSSFPRPDEGGFNKFNAITNLTVADGKKLTLNDDGTVTGTLDIKGTVNIAKNKVLTFSSTTATFGEHTNITGEGTLKFSDNTKTTTIKSLTNCIDCGVLFVDGKSITYDAACTRILAGTYNNLTTNSAEVTLCGEVSVGGKYTTNSITINGASNDTIKFYGDIATSNKSLIIMNANAVANGTKNYSISSLNITNDKTFTIKGNTTINKDIVLIGEGSFDVKTGATLTFNNSTNFNANTTIKGNGNVIFKSTLKADGKKLITYANATIADANSNMQIDTIEVKDNTFNYNRRTDPKPIRSLIIDGGKFVHNPAGSTSTNLSGVAILKSGTLEIATGKTLKLNNSACDTLKVTGTAIIKGSGTLDGVVAVYAGGNLTIGEDITIRSLVTVGDNAQINIANNKNLTLNGALAINGNTNITSDGTGTITFATGNTINVLDSKTLTVSNTLNVAGDVTLDGHIIVAEDATFNLNGSNINFTTKSNFKDTEGTISFVNGVTISGLKINPEASPNCLRFGANVTYDNTCTAIFPYKYTNLTLGTDAGNNIALFGNVEVTNNLDWSNGRILLNGNKLYTTHTFNVGTFNNSHMVVAGKGGQLIYKADNNITSGNFTLIAPIGTSSITSSGALQYVYSPDTIVVNAASTNIAVGDTIASQVDCESQSGKSSDLRRYWTITSNKTFTGTLKFKFDNADDVLGYGASESHFWRAFHNREVFNEDEPMSPFDNNTIVLTGVTDIRGTWTACEYPAVTTLYAFADGDWDKPETWTTSSAGSTWINPGGNTTPNTRKGEFDVVILSGRVVKGTSSGIYARSVLLQTENSKLIIPKVCDKIEINNISGSGVLVIKDKGEFPDGIENTELFMAPDGGTTMFEGTPTGIDATPTLSKTTFNNLIIDLKSGGGDKIPISLPASESHKLQINGDFNLENGEIIYTAGNQTIHVDGDVNISSGGAITNASGVGDRTTADTLQIGGDFINRGNVRLTMREYCIDGDRYTLAINDEGTDGRGILRFVGEKDVRFECRNKTNISQLIVDKGVDWTYRVTLEVYSNEANFGLLGRSNYTAATGFEKSKAYPAAPVELNKPLWLKSGTLELTGKTKIYSLAEQPIPKEDSYDCAYIPAAGCLHLNGEEVFVQTSCCPTTTAWTDLIPAGKLLVEDGTLDGGKSSGITFVGTSFVEVKKGTVRMSQFRASEYATNGLTTYIQSGGNVTFDGNGDIKNGLPIFFMPEASYTFQMTDGTLEVGSSMNGAFVVKSNPENGKITGGTIIINTGAAIKDGKDVSIGEYLIATELPLYNLVLKNDQKNGLASNKYMKHYINDIVNVVYLKKYTVNIIASTTIQNDLTIEGNGSPTPGSQYNVIFDTQGKPVTVGGNLYIKNGAVVYTQGANEFIMNGVSDDDHECSINVEGKVVVSGTDATEGFHNLTIADGAEVKMKSDITVRGDFRLGSRAVIKDDESNKTYTIMGNAYIEGTYEKNSSKLCKMVLKGENIYSTGNGVLSYVEIDAGNDLTLSDPNTSGRQTKLTITGNLNFASNTRFNIGGNNLVFSSDASVSGDFKSNCMILTTGTSARGVTKEFETPGNFLFPFGIKDAENNYYHYTPAYFEIGTAATYGSITSRPIYGQAFRENNSLKCYWNTEAHGFSGVSIPQKYFWYDVPSEDILFSLAPDLSNWVPARRYNSEWTTYSNNFIDYEPGIDPDEHNIFIGASDNINGYYTCGAINAFENTAPLYSCGAEGATLDWFNPESWSTVGHNGPFGTSIPSPTTAVYIGHDTISHTVIINWKDDGVSGNAECASLNIAPGSVLDLNDYTEFEAPIVEVGETGAGTLRISTGSFPNGDFGQFNGEFGGTVEYYSNEDGDKGYTIPKASANGTAVTTYHNLIISGGAINDSIIMPDCNITVFDTLTISGRVSTNTNHTNTIDVHKNMNIADEGMFMIFEDGSDNLQTVQVAGNLNVMGTLLAYGTAANTKANKLQIGGDLRVDGKFKALNSNYKFDTEFVGETNSRIYGDCEEKIEFNLLTCNKDNLDTKLTLETNNFIPADANKPLNLEKGTFEVAITGTVTLSKGADMTIPADACLSVVSGEAIVANKDGRNKLNLNGHILVKDNGILRIGINDTKNKHNDILYASDGKPSINVKDNGKLIVRGQISRLTTSEMGSLIWEQNGGEVTIYGYERADNPTFKARGAFEIANNGEFKMTGGTLIIKGVSGDDQYGDIYIKPVKSECTGGTIVAAGNGTQKIHTSVNLFNLEVANGASLNAYTDINVNGLQIDNTGRYNALGHKLTIRKRFFNENNEAVSGASEGFSCGAASHLTHFVGTDMEFKGINDSETQFKDVIIDGNLDLIGEHSNIRIGGNLTQESGTVTDNGNVISLYGNLVYNGTFTGEGGINFCRDNDIQYIEGGGLGTIGTLTINNPNEVHLSTDLHITNKLVLGASLYINRSRLILDEGVTVTSSGGDFDGGRMIRLNGEHEDNGVIQYLQHNPKTYIIPIGVLQGSSRYYTPAIYDFESNSLADGVGSITVKTIKSLHKNLTFEPTKWLDYYWVVTTNGFGEERFVDFDAALTANFKVTQQYIYPNGKTDGTEGDMFPEYMYYGGDHEFEWIDLRAKENPENPEAPIAAKAWLKNKNAEDNDTIVFDSFGHLYGDYTAGCIGTDIYTGRPVLYSNGNGNWDNPATWIYYENGEPHSYASKFEDEDIDDDFRINGNPVHIRAGDSICVKNSHTYAYSVTFDDGENLGKLNINTTIGNDFGRVKGAGHLIMEPITADENYYKMPAGNFTSFLDDTRSIIEFSGGNGKLPNAVIGQVSNPLQNVILSGSGEKRLTKEFGEYINGYMLIQKGTWLNFGNTPIHIKGNWIDKNTERSGFISGASADRSLVEFNGTNKQQIILSNDQTSFHKLQINNPEDVEILKSDDEGVTIGTANVTVKNSLTLTNGCLIDMDNSLVTLNGASITATSSKYVVGPLAKVMTKNSDFTFPIGTIDEVSGNKVYSPTKLIYVSKAGTYIATFHSGSFGETPEEDVPWPFNEISNTEYWTIDAEGITDATAKLGIRVSDNTFVGLKESMLKKVSIAGKQDDEWKKIASKKTSGSLPEAIFTSDNAIDIDGFSKYTFGISASTGKLIAIDKATFTKEYDICDGDSSVTIPIFFTGSGGPYSAKLKITDTENDRFVVKEFGSLRSEDVITLTGKEFGTLFGKSDGYSTAPYVIEIIEVKDNGEDGSPAGGNKAEVNVHYNALPDIDGVKTVGMGDKRSYQIIVTEPANYLWSTSPDNIVDFTTTTEAETQITFRTVSDEPYSITLKAKSTYTEDVNEGHCVRENTKVINVETKPQPLIVGSFGLCKSNTNEEMEFSTEKVDGHEYQWRLTKKDDSPLEGFGTKIILNTTEADFSENNDKCTIEWNSDFSATEAKLSVIERYATGDIENPYMENSASREITFYEPVTIEGEITAPAICDNTNGEVTLTTTNSNYSYTIYNGTTPIGSAFNGTGGEKKISTSEPLRYTGSPYEITIVVKNKGCEATEDKEIVIHEKPTFESFAIADSDLYIGNLARVRWKQTSSVKPVNYLFTYDGAVYNGENSYGKIFTPEEMGKDKSGILLVGIPQSENMKGTFTITSAESDNKCTNSFDIDKPIKQDYLWRGINSDWNDNGNWWTGEKPSSDKNVVIRKGAAGDSEVTLPIVSSDVPTIKNIKIEKGASVTINEGNTLTIDGDIENLGAFDGSGEVEFTAKAHNVSCSQTANFANITISDGGTVNANSDINVIGNIVNNGIISGDNKIVLKGTTAAQIISGNGTFKNIEVNNSKGINVTSDMSVANTGSLTLTDGLINLNGNTLHFEANSTTTEGVNTASGKSWIVGNVKKTWAAGRQNEFTFPIGTENRMAMLGIEPTKSGAEFEVNYSYEDRSAEGPIILEGNLIRVSEKERWNITCSAKTPSYITLHWMDTESSGITSGAENESLVVAHKKSNGAWEGKSASKVTGKNAIRTNSSVNDYSPFTFGSTVEEEHPLPVSFAAFTGRQDGNSIVLEWATMSENNNDYFEIERSTDGVNYVTIGYADGAGNSNSRIDYIFSDNAPEQGRLYYRLSQVDFDGTREYADKVVTVTFANNKLTVSIVPNPTSGMFTLQNCGNSGQLVIMTQNGMVVKEFEVTDFNQQINIGDLANGIYIAKYTTDSESTILKIVKF